MTVVYIFYTQTCFFFFLKKKKKKISNVYRKNTFSGAYTNFNNFITETYKTGLIA